MAAKSRTRARNPEKESYWRQQLKAWKESGLSQLKYCKEHGLNHHTFSSWNYIIRGRERQASQSISPAPDITPTFAKVELEPEVVALPTKQERSRASLCNVTAELVNIETGVKLRIFNGADQATLAAVLSAWSER